MMLAPILLFVYNRPAHAKRAIEALLHNTLAAESELFIYSDAARSPEDCKSVNEVRSFIHSVNGFKKVHIIEREKNYGLARSIIDGVTTQVNAYGRTIVLEDDLVTAPYFLQFMNSALEMYKDEPRIGHIQACDFTQDPSLPDTFLIKWTGSWGWATWDRADGGRVAAEDFSQRLGNGSGFPIDQNADQHQHHVDHVGRGAASLEEFGRDPSADDRSGDARVVVQREGQVALRGIHDIHLLQVDRRPVADAVTHQIDESVGQGDEPENLVLENVVDEEFFEGDFLFFSLGGLYRRVIVAVFVDGRQPAGLGNRFHNVNLKKK